MKILLGGVPFGCDNIGDEAILACVVRMFRESLPSAELTVATHDPKTAELLGVKVVPSYGFAGVPSAGFGAVAAEHDAYVWCGATGLSDYPDTALGLLEQAQAAGVATYVWGVGMDDELNPVFFKVAGKRRMLLGLLGLVGWYERRLRTRLGARLQRTLSRCRGIWLRDPQSREMLASLGFTKAELTADTAFLLRPVVAAAKTVPKRLGLCFSAQRQLSDFSGVRDLVQAVRAAGYGLIGLPMNPKTDRAPLEALGVKAIDGDTPEAIVAAAAECSLVLSSRLHLLILAANAGTQGLGIARGSKLANWLSNFDQTVEGSVQRCDWAKVTEHVLALLADDRNWSARRDAAYAHLQARFDAARETLFAKLTVK